MISSTTRAQERRLPNIRFRMRFPEEIGNPQASAQSGWSRERSTPRGMSAIRMNVQEEEEEEEAPNGDREDFVRDVSPFATANFDSADPRRCSKHLISSVISTDVTSGGCEGGGKGKGEEGGGASRKSRVSVAFCGPLPLAAFSTSSSFLPPFSRRLLIHVSIPGASRGFNDSRKTREGTTLSRRTLWASLRERNRARA